jgi:predicted alpha/beta hydrolase
MKKRNYLTKIAIIAFPCFIFFGCTIVALGGVSLVFGRVEEPPKDEFYDGWKETDQVSYPREQVYFKSGGNRLQGFIYGGSNNNGLVVISEGFGATADKYFPMIKYFVDNNWRVFAFNNTGVSGSEGDSIRGLTQSLLDLDAALIYIENSSRFNGLPVMLAGHSMGGWAVCAVLNYNHNVKAVVSFAGYNKGRDALNKQGMSIPIFGSIFPIVMPQTWAIEKQLFGNTANLTAVGGINKSGIPVMIVQCSNDDTIPANTISIYAHFGEINNPNATPNYREGDNATGHKPFYTKDQTLDLTLMGTIDTFFNNSKL